jgi:hypothetical protein
MNFIKILTILVSVVILSWTDESDLAWIKRTVETKTYPTVLNHTDSTIIKFNINSSCKITYSQAHYRGKTMYQSNTWNFTFSDFDPNNVLIAHVENNNEFYFRMYTTGLKKTVKQVMISGSRAEPTVYESNVMVLGPFKEGEVDGELLKAKAIKIIKSCGGKS